MVIGRSLRVMKFGGSSVADAEKIKNVARRIAEARESGDHVLAVVSARGKTTDGPDLTDVDDVTREAMVNIAARAVIGSLPDLEDR
jgi:aspartokinase